MIKKKLLLYKYLFGSFLMSLKHIPLLCLGSQDIQCELHMNLLCWGSGELGQTGHGRPGDISPEEAHMRELSTVVKLDRVKLLACGSSHSIVTTGTGPSSLIYYLLSFIVDV